MKLTKVFGRELRGILVVLGLGIAGSSVVGTAAAQATPTAAPVAAATTTATAAPAPAPAATAAPQDFSMELGTIEEQVNGLKERVFRSKATLELLKEIVVQGTSTGSRASVWHVNKLSSAYAVESVAYYLDGQGKFSKSDATGALDASKEFKVYDGAIPPGNHSLMVTLKLRGTGYGVFSYVQDYNFTVQSSTAFQVDEGKTCQIRVITSQRSGIGRSFTERPTVDFETRCMKMTEETEQQ